MPQTIVRDADSVTVLSSRILAERPMVMINGKVQYLSSGTSMKGAGGKVVGLFENTWMGACGVGDLRGGFRKINKMGNTNLALDVDVDRGAFDAAVINALRAAIPEFGTESLNAFYAELMRMTGEDGSTVRRGVSASLGKIAVQDLLLSGALSKDSPFFTQTTVGKAIRKKGIEKYGIIEIHEEIDLMGKPVIVDYPPDSDPEFKDLKDEHLPNNHVSDVLRPKPSTSGLNAPPNPPSSYNLYFRLLCGVSMVLGVVGLIVAFAALNVATLGTAGGIALAVVGGLCFFGGGVGLVASRDKHSDDNQSAPEGKRP